MRPFATVSAAQSGTATNSTSTAAIALSISTGAGTAGASGYIFWAASVNLSNSVYQGCVYVDVVNHATGVVIESYDFYAFPDWFPLGGFFQHTYNGTGASVQYDLRFKVDATTFANGSGTVSMQDGKMVFFLADPTDVYQAVDTVVDDSSNAAGAWVAQATLTFTPATVGTYVIFASSAFCSLVSGTPSSIRLRDTTTGTVYALFTPSGLWQYDGNRYWPYNAIAQVALTAASHSFAIEVQNNSTVYALNSKFNRILGIRVDSFGNSVGYAEARAAATTSTGALISAIAGSYTPFSGGTYLLIGSALADVQGNEGSYSYDAQMQATIGGTALAGALLGFDGPYAPWAIGTFTAPNTSAVALAFKIGSSSAGNVVGYSDAAIVMLPTAAPPPPPPPPLPPPPPPPPAVGAGRFAGNSQLISQARLRVGNALALFSGSAGLSGNAAILPQSPSGVLNGAGNLSIITKQIFILSPAATLSASGKVVANGALFGAPPPPPPPPPAPSEIWPGNPDIITAILAEVAQILATLDGMNAELNALDVEIDDLAPGLAPPPSALLHGQGGISISLGQSFPPKAFFNGAGGLAVATKENVAPKALLAGNGVLAINVTRVAGAPPPPPPPASNVLFSHQFSTQFK